MALDLNILGNPAEKTKEQYISDGAKQVAQLLRFAQVQIRNNRDNVRKIILENEQFTAAEFNEFIGAVASEQLAEIDLASSELLAKVTTGEQK